MQITDAYTHCGLSKYEPIEGVKATMQSAGVTRAVMAQHLGEYDNRYIGQIAADDPDHFAAVGMVDHASPDCAEELRRLARAGQIKGVRLIADVFETLPQLPAAAAESGVIIVLYPPKGMTACMAGLRRFFEAYPDARLVITHLGTPDPAGAPDFEKEQAVFELAKYPGVYYQVSGMKMYCAYPHEVLYPLIETACERFGPRRLCWGSNYPVVGGENDYIADLKLLLDGRLPIPEEAIELVAGENAGRLWF